MATICPFPLNPMMLTQTLSKMSSEMNNPTECSNFNDTIETEKLALLNHVNHLNKMNESKKNNPERKKLEAERLLALASLSPEERASFFNVMNFMKNESQLKCKSLENLLDKKISSAEVSAKQPETRKDVQHAKLITTMAKRSANALPSHKLNCADLQKEISLILKVANHYSLKPINVTEELKMEYRTEKANEAAEELLKEEATKSQTNRAPVIRGNKSKNARNTKSKGEQALNSINKREVKNIQNKQDPVAINLKVQKICNLFDMKGNTVEELSRVTQRWRSKNLNDLKKLTDYQNGFPVHSYQEMSAEELTLQRARHFLPGIETILAAPDARAKYAFATNKGYGMLTMLVIKNKTYEGVIYFGLETQIVKGNEHLKIYHKYFEQVSGFDEVFSDIIDSPEDLNELSEGWESVGPYSITCRKDGKLDVCFQNEEHKLVIYPLA